MVLSKMSSCDRTELWLACEGEAWLGERDWGEELRTERRRVWVQEGNSVRARATLKNRKRIHLQMVNGVAWCRARASSSSCSDSNKKQQRDDSSRAQHLVRRKKASNSSKAPYTHQQEQASCFDRGERIRTAGRATFDS